MRKRILILILLSTTIKAFPSKIDNELNEINTGLTWILHAEDSLDTGNSLSTIENNFSASEESHFFYSPNTIYNLKFPTSFVRNHYFNKELMHGSITKEKNIWMKDLDFALQVQNKFNTRSDLGVFGNVMIYTNAAAAATLLYIHLKKYGKEYKWFD